MLIPLNKHLVVEPVVHESFIQSPKDTYEEIGVVLAVAEGITEVKVGERVFFDSWMCAKYPVEGDSEKYHWLVQMENVRAKQTHAEIPE